MTAAFGEKTAECLWFLLIPVTVWNVRGINIVVRHKN